MKKMNAKRLKRFSITFFFGSLIGNTAFATLESSLRGFKSDLTGTILPILAVIGICFAGIAFFLGHENARKYILFACIGVAIGFGSQVIVDFISGLIH